MCCKGQEVSGKKKHRPIWRVVFLGTWTVAILALAWGALGKAPEFAQQFQQQQMTLPAITVTALQFSQALAAYWFVLPAAWALIGAVFASGLCDRCTPVMTFLVLLATLAGAGVFYAAFLVPMQSVQSAII